MDFFPKNLGDVAKWVNLQSTPDWGRPLAFDSRSPYIDTETGLHGTREYVVQLMKDEKPMGERSDVVVVLMG